MVRKPGKPGNQQLASVVGYLEFDYSQSEIAERLGLDERTVANYRRISAVTSVARRVLDGELGVQAALRLVGPATRKGRK